MLPRIKTFCTLFLLLQLFKQSCTLSQSVLLNSSNRICTHASSVYMHMQIATYAVGTGALCLVVFRALSGIPFGAIWVFTKAAPHFHVDYRHVLLGAVVGVIAALFAILFMKIHHAFVKVVSWVELHVRLWSIPPAYISLPCSDAAAFPLSCRQHFFGICAAQWCKCYCRCGSISFENSGAVARPEHLFDTTAGASHPGQIWCFWWICHRRHWSLTTPCNVLGRV